MATNKPHEMSFTEFANAIKPSWMIGSPNPAKTPAIYSEWLIDVWDSTDHRTDYSIDWYNDALKNELPPEARHYQFDDLSLHQITARLGLDPASQDDNRKAAELLALRNAWVTAIQHHYGQFATDISECTLTDAAAAEYLLLTCGLRHPWIRQQVDLHLAEQDRKRQEQASKGGPSIEMSDDPNWPDTQVIHVRLPDPCPYEAAYRQAMFETKEESIDDWITRFKSMEGGWTSAFEMHACDAQIDIDIARQKIDALQQIIENQESQIQRARKIIGKHKKHDAAMRQTKRAGRPEKSQERQDVAIKFAMQWVKSLMKLLAADNCAQLDAMIEDNRVRRRERSSEHSRERNWQRWLNGQAAPTHKSLSLLLNTKITQGEHKGIQLQLLPTEPELHKLMSLVLLNR